MKYCNLGFKFDEPDVWKYEARKQKPLTFHDIRLKQEKFEREKKKLREDFTKYIIDPLDNCETDEQIAMTLDPVFERMSKSYFMSENINDELLLKKANRNTLDKKLKEWCAQLNVNAPLIRTKPGISVFQNKFKDVPCVVVAAGPSLGNSIEYLKEIQDKCLIMSVDTSFRSCYRRGIIPHFCNAHDANINGQRFFKDQPCPDTVGLFVNYIHPKTIESYQGPLAFYYVGDDAHTYYVTMALACDSADRKDGSFLKSSVTGGSSVAHTAYYLALLFGCNPVTFIGLDLSYPDLDKSHFETDNPKNIREKKLIDVEDLQGRMIKTDLSFYSYKTVFEKMAAPMAGIFGSKVFNSSEDSNGKPAGVIHHGLRPLPFKEFINLYCQEDRPELKKIKEYYDGKSI